MNSPLRRAALIIAGYKTLSIAAVIVFALVSPNSFNRGNYEANFHDPARPAPSAIEAAFTTWDTQHFLHLARAGYVPGAVSNNFYPLWPALIALAGGGWIGALLLSNLFSFAGFLLFYRYAALRHGEEAARCALWLLLAYPGALFFQFPYSESLFLLLATGAFYFLHERRPASAAACSFLLALARPQGLLAAPALGITPLLGFAAYLGIMKLSTGNAFEGFSVYRDLYPFAPTPLKLLNPAAFLARLAEVRGAHVYIGSLLDRVWFAALLPLLWLARRDRTYFLYMAAVGLIPAITLSLVSYTRHFVLVFPAFLVAGVALQGEARRVPRRLILSAFWIIQALLLFRHAANNWAG